MTDVVADLYAVGDTDRPPLRSKIQLTVRFHVFTESDTRYNSLASRKAFDVLRYAGTVLHIALIWIFGEVSADKIQYEPSRVVTEQSHAMSCPVLPFKGYKGTRTLHS